MELFTSIILWLLMGAITSYFSRRRGRDPIAWFFIGMLLGLLGLLLLFILPAIKPVVEKEVIGGETIVVEPIKVEPVDELLLNEWFYLDKSRHQQGPISFSALRDCLLQGVIDENTFLWCEGMDNWKRLRELKEIENRLKR